MSIQRSRAVWVSDRRVTPTDRLGRLTRFLYDAAGNLVSTYLPSGEERHTIYDALNRAIELQYVPGAGGTTT
jgi:YD repeat-containing protein